MRSALLMTLSVVACTTPIEEDVEDTADASALGKSDSVTEGSTEAKTLLSLVNDPRITFQQLDDDAGLSARAAQGIIELRDSQRIDDLAELDAVPFVGPAAFARLVSYASDRFSSAPQHALVSGRLTEDTTWSPSMGRIAWSSLTVPAGVTLRVTAGTMLDAGYLFRIEGTLVVEGVPSAPVHLTGNPDDTFDFSGLECLPGGRIVADGLEIENATHGLSAQSGCAGITARGISVRSFAGFGLWLEGATNAAVDGLFVTDNVAHDGIGNGGRAVAVFDGASATLANVVISGAPGILNSGGEVVLDHATIVSPSITAALSSVSALQTTVRNTIIAGGHVSGGATTLDRVLLWNTQDFDLPATATLVRQDPGFVSEADLRLRVGSPAVDAGVAGVDRDIAGSQRDTKPDLGAYELVR